MALPLFFHGADIPLRAEIALEEDTARHIVQVLRMQAGGHIRLTNGKGIEAIAIITRADKKRCSVIIENITQHTPAKPSLTLAVCFTKNASRNEWLLEKATELGVKTIIPVISTRSEREHFRFDRLNNILIAAMMQSQQYFLPELKGPTPFSKAIHTDVTQRLIAHCMNDGQRLPLHLALSSGKNTIACIGPEGDFTEDEVKDAMDTGYQSVDLGINRLRTETAAMAVCAFFNMMNI